MKEERFYYLVHFEYLGFRYHGWQKQKDVKTVQYMVDRTLSFIFKHDNFKTLAASRTDAMVSATHQVFELFIYEEQNPKELEKRLNENLPADIRVQKIESVNKDFQIISGPKIKEYHYYFSFKEKNHPYCAPFLVNFTDELDIEVMKIAAKMYEGEHNFKEYCYRPNEKKLFDRKILRSEIVENNFITASFFPKNSFAFVVKGNGFLHHQIRIMMGALIRVGRKEITLKEIENSLFGKGSYPIGFIAPSSGLHLFKNELISDYSN